jgi:hypothetical protein
MNYRGWPILERSFGASAKLAEVLEDDAALLSATNRTNDAAILTEQAAKIRTNSARCYQSSENVVF